MSTSLDKLRAAMESASPTQGEKSPIPMTDFGNPNSIRVVMGLQ